MEDFKSYFLLDTSSAAAYSVRVLSYFDSVDGICCEEIGDGNINYVFRLSKNGRSLVLKQGDRLLRSSGRPLDKNRSYIESEILSLQAELCPGFVPELLSFDKTMNVIAMEDISQYKNLRSELMAGRLYGHLADNLSEFLVSSLLPTSDLVLPPEEKKARVKFFTNIDMCAISEDLVFTEPYLAEPLLERNRNIISPGNEAFVKKELYDNFSLQAEIAKLRLKFTDLSQALIHGDLHSGSIFVNEKGIKVIDPEFAFYGPMGYDIGNVLAHLLLALAYRAFVKKAEFREYISLISDFHEKTFAKLSERCDELVSFPIYKNKSFKTSWIDEIKADTAGFAGTELIRRVVGDAKAAELTSLPLTGTKLKMERALIRAGQCLIQTKNLPEAVESIIKGAEDINGKS